MGLHIASRMKYLAIVAFIFPLGIFGQKFSELEINRWKKQAQQVIIIRDNWGVPHVYGNTDADAVFGFAYAQAEDAFDQAWKIITFVLWQGLRDLMAKKNLKQM